MFTTLIKAIGQRQRVLKACLIILLLSLCASRNRALIRRSCKRFVRNTGWWNLVWNTYDESRFKKTFRVSRSTFLYILYHIRSALEEKKLLVKSPYLLSKGLGFACIDLVGGTIFTLKWNGWNRSVNCACYCIWSIGRTRSFYVENIHRKPYTKDSQRIRNGNGQYAANAAVPTLLASHWWLPPTDKMPSWGS